jgi:hypothetical protein
MDQAFGKSLQGKVDCIGLHGDYEAGLQMIREGKLPSLRRESTCTTSPSLSGLTDSPHSQVASEAIVTPEVPFRPLDNSPPFSPRSEAITPGIEAHSLPSTVTDSSYEMSRCGNDSASLLGTWTPFTSESLNPSTISSHGPAPAQHTTDNIKPARPLHFVFLGSSLGNFDRESAAPFLKGLPLRPGDTLLIGLDGRPQAGAEGRRKVEVAYNDPAGHTRAFEEHGWDVVRQQLGLKDEAGVEFVGRYNEVLGEWSAITTVGLCHAIACVMAGVAGEDEERLMYSGVRELMAGRHEAYFRSKGQQTLHLPNAGEDITLEDGELLNIEWSYKVGYTTWPSRSTADEQYSHGECLQLFKDADLNVINSWKAPDSEYRLWLVERPSVRFIQDAKDMVGNRETAIERAKGVPKWDEWRAMWSLWDQ